MGDNIAPPVVHQALSSDHLPVVADVGSSVNRHRNHRRNYHRVDWDRFQRCVDSNLDYMAHPVSTEDVDQQILSIETAISVARERHVPEVRQVSQSVEIDDFTKLLIRRRNATRRQFQRTGYRWLKSQCNRMTKIIQARMVVLRNESFANKIRSLPDCARPFWKMTKILKSKPRPIPPLIPLDNADSKDRLISPGEKAAELGQHFANSHKLGHDVVSPHDASVSLCASNLQLIPNDFSEELEITAVELTKYISSSGNMKAPGFDNIFNLELKKLSFQFFEHLALVFNQCLRLSYFPSRWKSAKVIPIQKPGKDPSSPKSYRPISLLSAISKLFERAIHCRLATAADQNNILLEEQFGFRRGRSTVHQLSRVTNTLRRNKSLSKSSVMALLDIEKAFDNVWHGGLVFKLRRYNLPSYLVKIINNYLADRSFNVVLNGAVSDALGVPAGVPQGSVLGPLLFNLFTSDIPPLPDGGSLSLFADDTAIIHSGRVTRAITSKLQRSLDCLISFLTSWKISVNAAKTQVILFPYSQSPRLVPTEGCKITLNGSTVEWNDTAKYLGVTLDSKLLFRQQVDQTVNKSKNMIRVLYPLINRRSTLSVKNKLAVYKQVILPALEYGLPVWESCAKTHHLKLQRVQNKALRLITNSPWRRRNSEIHRLAGVKMLEERFDETLFKFRARCRLSEQPIIRGLVAPH